MESVAVGCGLLLVIGTAFHTSFFMFEFMNWLSSKCSAQNTQLWYKLSVVRECCTHLLDLTCFSVFELDFSEFSILLLRLTVILKIYTPVQSIFHLTLLATLDSLLSSKVEQILSLSLFSLAFL